MIITINNKIKIIIKKKKFIKNNPKIILVMKENKKFNYIKQIYLLGLNLKIKNNN